MSMGQAGNVFESVILCDNEITGANVRNCQNIHIIVH